MHSFPANITISIHTFLTEGDDKEAYRRCKVTKISIHTFLTEGDFKDYKKFHGLEISIHTFLTEGDHE